MHFVLCDFIEQKYKFNTKFKYLQYAYGYIAVYLVCLSHVTESGIEKTIVFSGFTKPAFMRITHGD